VLTEAKGKNKDSLSIPVHTDVMFTINNGDRKKGKNQPVYKGHLYIIITCLLYGKPVH